ncbi:hypothetical protein HK104_004736 [Borealophlyctis nickersoniae]|nr:hypothetical protein HK104_004736 [Borealophlyctis nickersoniae]
MGGGGMGAGKANANLVRAALEASRETENGKGLLAAASEGRVEGVEAWLAKGANADFADDKGRTALHFACVAGHLPVLNCLIKNSADVCAQDMNGNTPLHLAAISNQLDCVLALLRAGAKVSVTDNFSRTPLELVRSRLRIISDRESGKRTPQSLISEVRQLVEILALCTSAATATWTPALRPPPKPDSHALDMAALTDRLAVISTADDALDAIAEMQSMLDQLSINQS